MIKIISIKIISIGLAFFLIKFITFLFIIIFILINKESENFLNCKNNDSEFWLGNYSMKPINSYSVPDELPIASILYNKYWNEVFNLTYLKIKIGRKNFWFKILKKINLKALFRLIFYFLTGINRIFINIFKEVLNYKKKEKLENFLFKKFASIGDDRLIMKIKGEWVINGKIDIIKNKIRQKLIIENRISHENIEYAMPWIEKIIEKYDSRISENIKDLIIKKGVFANKITKKPHWHTFGILKDESKIPYITDEEKAIDNDNYGLKPVLKGVYLKKKSTLLEIEKDKTIFLENEVELQAHPFIKSAYYNGFNEKIMQDSFLNQIFFYEKMKLELYGDLKMVIYDEIIAKELEKTISDDLLDSFYKGIGI